MEDDSGTDGNLSLEPDIIPMGRPVQPELRQIFQMDSEGDFRL